MSIGMLEKCLDFTMFFSRSLILSTKKRKTHVENIRNPLSVLIQRRLDDKLPVTLEKRRFLEWYGQQKGTPGDKPDEK